MSRTNTGTTMGSGSGAGSGAGTGTPTAAPVPPTASDALSPPTAPDAPPLTAPDAVPPTAPEAARPPSASRRSAGGVGRGRPARTDRPARGVPRGARGVVDAGVLALAMVAAITPLLPVYGGTVLVLPVLGGVLVGLTVGVLAAWARWSPPTTTGVLLVVTALAGGPLATRDEALAGLLPTPDSVAAVVRGAALGWKDVLTLQPPLGGSGWLLVPPYLLATVGTAVAVRLALGGGRAAPAAAVLPPVCLGAAALLGSHDTVAPAVIGTALAVVLIVWASWRSGRTRGRRPVALVVLAALAVGGGLGAGAVVAGQRDRYVLRDALIPPFDPRDHASPLSAFRAFVKDDDTVELFTVRGLPEAGRIRLATFDRFDGVVWNVAGDGSARASGEFRRVGDTVSAQATEEAAAVAASGQGGERVEVEVEVANLDGVWLPTVGDAVSLRFDDSGAQSELRFNDATGAAVLTGGLEPGLRYTFDAVVPTEPEDEQVGGAPGSELDLPEPQSVPDAVVSAAADAARDAETPVQVARALEQALAEGGFFSHGLTDLGDYPSLSGHGADRLTSLLAGELMVGDDEQYAAAMALMARELGLPSRVVMGFVPGGDPAAADAATGEDPATDDATAGTGAGDEVVVTGQDVRAWVEIAFDGHGWVAFDPTPPQTQTPQDETETSPADPEPQVVQPPPPPADPVDPPEDDSEQPQTQDSLDESSWALWQRIALGVGAGSGVLLLLLAPLLVIAALKARRRRRRRHHPEPLRRVVGGWQEVLDLATDLRHDVDPVATRREGARTLERAFAAPTARTAPTAEEPAATPGTKRGRKFAKALGTTPSRRGGDRATVSSPVAGADAGVGADAVAGAEAGAAVVLLAERADAAVFGVGEPTTDDARSYWAQVDHALARMRAATPRTARWRGHVTTRSLRLPLGRRSRSGQRHRTSGADG